MSTRRGLELLLLLPGRADVAQTVISGTRSHPDCRTGGSKGWFCQSTSLKILRTILGNLYSSLEWGGRAIRPGEKLGIKRSSCLECGKGQKSSGEQRDPRYSLGALWRLCGGHRKSWPYWRSLLERVPGLGNPWSCSQAMGSCRLLGCQGRWRGPTNSRVEAQEPNLQPATWRLWEPFLLCPVAKCPQEHHGAFYGPRQSHLHPRSAHHLGLLDGRVGHWASSHPLIEGRSDSVSADAHGFSHCSRWVRQWLGVSHKSPSLHHAPRSGLVSESI